MGRMTIWTFVLCFAIIMAAVACTESDPDFPDQVNTFLSEEEILWLEHLGLTLHKGSDPPNIQGSYLLDTLAVYYDDLGRDFDLASYTYHFTDQIGDSINVSFSSPGANDEATNLQGYISGSGDCFNVFLNVLGTRPQCNYNMPQIISGCLSASGIIDWRWGLIMGEKAGSGCDGMLVDGHRRILEEADTLAARVSNSK